MSHEKATVTSANSGFVMEEGLCGDMETFLPNSSQISTPLQILNVNGNIDLKTDVKNLKIVIVTAYVVKYSIVVKKCLWILY